MYANRPNNKRLPNVPTFKTSFGFLRNHEFFVHRPPRSEGSFVRVFESCEEFVTILPPWK